MARLQQKMQAAGTTGSAETSRHSPRDGWNGCFASSPVLRAFWPPSPVRRVKRHSKLDTSVGVSGPRDLTVRINVVRRHGQPRCNIDTPTASRLNVRDDREAPLFSRRDATMNTLFLKKRNWNILRRGLDRGDRFESAEKMSFSARVISTAIDLTSAATRRRIAHLCRRLCARRFARRVGDG
jgi:hypothetical protein